LQNKYAKVGETVTFECEVEGRPTPIVHWFKEDNEIRDSSDYQITIDEGFCCLAISEVFPEDDGKFFCMASNVVGSTTTEAILRVHHKFYFSDRSYYNCMCQVIILLPKFCLLFVLNDIMFDITRLFCKKNSPVHSYSSGMHSTVVYMLFLHTLSDIFWLCTSDFSGCK